MEQDVARLLKELAPGAGAFTLTRLAGDASTRSYHRVNADGLDAPLVLMVLGPRGGAEEYGTIVRDGDELPFLHVQRIFAAVGLPVPAIHAYCPVARLMLLEDLGDTTLLAWQGGRDRAQIQAMYRAALDHLVALQARGLQAVPANSQLLRQRFTADVFRWELEHFVEFAIEAGGTRLRPAHRAALDDGFARIAQDLADLPVGIVHRDYHSRNLMVSGSRLGIIDFQDALLGPGAYDVVSLLRDAYVTLPEDEVEALAAHWDAGLAAAGAPRTADPARALHLCALQRCLKAAGRFCFFLHTRGDDRYLCYVPGALANARRALRSQPDLAAVHEALAAYVPGL